MSAIEHRTPGLTRRAFIGGAAVVAGALALAGCGTTEQGTTAADDAGQAEEEAAEAPEAASDEPTKGGTFRFYLTNPVAIEPFGAEENMGVEVMYNLFMPLCEYDYEKGEVVPAAAESWEVNDAADEFTFHLRQDGKFHNGNPVRAQDFKYSWERLCRADFKPAPSALGYKVAQVAGADEMMAGEADELDVECPDDYTLVVHLKAPFADFPFVVCERALCPVPEGCTDTEEDFQAFRVAPIGNGPFMMDGEWVDGQYIQLKRFDDYWGEKPHIDGVVFQIYADSQTSWAEFQAGNLDFAVVPSGMFDATRQQYGEAGQDGYLANPGQQYFCGSQLSIFYLLMNDQDELLSNRDLRIAVSCAINRQAMCETVFQGTRTPADNVIMPGLACYEPGAWDFCPPEGDKELAAEYFDKAGYPLDENGSRNLSLRLATNSGSSNEMVMQMIQADLAACGVDATIDLQEWAAYIDSLQSGTFQMGRYSWILTAPNANSVLDELFSSASPNNYGHYASEEFDEAVKAASQIADEDERNQAYRDANAIVAADFPFAPLMFYTHYNVTSARVHNLFLNPGTMARLNRCWLEG